MRMTQGSLSTVLNQYGIERKIDLSMLPASEKQLQLNAVTSIPLYGSLIGVEIELIARLQAIRNRLVAEAERLLKLIDERYPSCFDQNVRLSLLIKALDNGLYYQCPPAFVDFPETLQGVVETLELLAGEYGLDGLFVTLNPMIDGVPDTRLAQLVDNMDTFMLAVGIPGSTQLERVNNMLKKAPVHDFTLASNVDITDIPHSFSETDIANLAFLVSDECVPEIIIACRTGNFNVNFLAYMPQQDDGQNPINKEAVVSALLAETSPKPSLKVSKRNKAQKANEEDVADQEVNDSAIKKS